MDNMDHDQTRGRYNDLPDDQKERVARAVELSVDQINGVLLEVGLEGCQVHTVTLADMKPLKCTWECHVDPTGFIVCQCN